MTAMAAELNLESRHRYGWDSAPRPTYLRASKSHDHQNCFSRNLSLHWLRRWQRPVSIWALQHSLKTANMASSSRQNSLAWTHATQRPSAVLPRGCPQACKIHINIKRTGLLLTKTWTTICWRSMSGTSSSCKCSGGPWISCKLPNAWSTKIRSSVSLSEVKTFNSDFVDPCGQLRIRY